MEEEMLEKLKILLKKKRKIYKKMRKYELDIFKVENDLLTIGKNAPLTKSIEGYVFSKGDSALYYDEDRIFSKNLPKIKKRELN